MEKSWVDYRWFPHTVILNRVEIVVRKILSSVEEVRYVLQHCKNLPPGSRELDGIHNTVKYSDTSKTSCKNCVNGSSCTRYRSRYLAECPRH